MRNAEATKKRLLEAGIHEFAEHGPSGARVDRVAERARANKQLIYAYFGKKDDFFLAVVDYVRNVMREATEFDPQRLGDYAYDIHAYAVRHPCHMRVLTWWTTIRAEATHAEVARVSRILEAVSRAQAAGHVRDDIAPEAVIALVFGAAQALFSATDSLVKASPTDLTTHAEAMRAFVNDWVAPRTG